MTKIVLDDIVSTQNVQKINANFEKIAEELNTKSLSRKPEGEPNFLDDNLDLNGYRILNSGAPVAPTDLMRKVDVEKLITDGIVIVENTEGLNLGGGLGVYVDKVGKDLRFKSLIAGTNVTLTEDGSSITVNASNPDEGANSLSVSHLKALPPNPKVDTVYDVIGFYEGAVTGGGRFIWLPEEAKTLHNGVTHYAPEALSTWNGTKEGLSTLFDWTGSGTGVFVRASLTKITPDLAGAVGDLEDDRVALSKVLVITSSLRIPLYGTTSTYGVSGNLVLPSWSWVEDLNLKQLSPAVTNRRTLFQAFGEFCRLKNIKVDRNGDGGSGTLSDAAGVWINDCPRLEMHNVEVFGDDAGSGIAVIRCDNAEIHNPFVHDITAGTSASIPVTDDTLHGVWIQGGVGVRLTNPRVRNLLNRWTGQAAFNRFSRGIAVGGAKQFSITSPMVDNVDQGLDLTGDQNPEFFEVNGGIFSNCYTWGTKCANSVQNGVFTGVIAYRCGQSGFVASAPSIVMTDRTQNISYVGCKSIQTGYGGVWTSIANVAGFRVANTIAYTDYPRSIKYIGCSSDGNGGNMEYGFFSDSGLGTLDGEQWVEALHCDVQGATVKSYYGIQTGYAKRLRNTSFSVPNDVWTDLDFNATTDYMGAATAVASTVLSPTRPGVYLVTSGVTFAGGSSAGTRGIRILLDGAVVQGSVVRVTAVDSNEKNLSTSVILPISTAGSQIKTQVLQSSGSALDVTGPTAMNLALISAGFGG